VVKIHFMWKMIDLPFRVKNYDIAVVALFLDGQVVGLVANNNHGYGKSGKKKFSKKPISRALKLTNI